MMVKKRRPYKPPPLQGPEVVEVKQLGPGTTVTTTQTVRGVLRSSTEHTTTSDLATIDELLAFKMPNARTEFERKREGLRAFLTRRGLKTDEQFSKLYEGRLRDCMFGDAMLRYSESATEPHTQASAALPLIRLINFLLANFSDEQLLAILAYGAADRTLILATYNKEITAGKKSIDAARQAAEQRAQGRAAKRDAWVTLARDIAAEYLGEHPDWNRSRVAIAVAKRLKAKHGIDKQPDTIARAIRE